MLNAFTFIALSMAAVSGRVVSKPRSLMQASSKPKETEYGLGNGMKITINYQKKAANYKSREGEVRYTVTVKVTSPATSQTLITDAELRPHFYTALKNKFSAGSFNNLAVVLNAPLQENFLKVTEVVLVESINDSSSRTTYGWDNVQEVKATSGRQGPPREAESQVQWTGRRTKVSIECRERRGGSRHLSSQLGALHGFAVRKKGRRPKKYFPYPSH